MSMILEQEKILNTSAEVIKEISIKITWFLVLIQWWKMWILKMYKSKENYCIGAIYIVFGKSEWLALEFL